MCLLFCSLILEISFLTEKCFHIGQDPPKLDMPVFDSKMADPEPVDVQIDVF